MYTTITATREQGLVAAAAAERDGEVCSCCKSQFKSVLRLWGDDQPRGQDHTLSQTTYWMTLRYRAPTAKTVSIGMKLSFIRSSSGNNMWVHIGCIPCYWDQGLDQDGKRLTRPCLRPIHGMGSKGLRRVWGMVWFRRLWYRSASTLPFDERVS